MIVEVATRQRSGSHYWRVELKPFLRVGRSASFHAAFRTPVLHLWVKHGVTLCRAPIGRLEKMPELRAVEATCKRCLAAL